MSDPVLDLLEAPFGAQHRGPRCTVSTWLDSLTQEQAARISALIDDPDGPPLSEVYNRLAQVGCPRPEPLRRHRRRVERIGDYCTCPA